MRMEAAFGKAEAAQLRKDLRTLGLAIVPLDTTAKMRRAYENTLNPGWFFDEIWKALIDVASEGI